MNIFKYQTILDLEKKSKEDFSLAEKDICFLPPVLKKTGGFFSLCFLVIEFDEKKDLSIKRPIGCALYNCFTKRLKTYNFKFYDFIEGCDDFSKEYYTTEKEFFPLKNFENQEKYRLLLEQLFLLTEGKTLFKNIDQEGYQNYLKNLKSLFPKCYHKFFDEIQSNKISLIDANTLEKRDFFLEQQKESDKEKKKNLKKKTLMQKALFHQRLENDIVIFVKSEILPLLKNKGTYNKLLFFDSLGTFFKKIDSEISDYKNCFDSSLPSKQIEKNILEKTNMLKYETIKLFSKAQNENPKSRVLVDTLSKLLVVFMNSMLVQEVKNCLYGSTEAQIFECKEAIKGDITKVEDQKAKSFLSKIFGNLEQDYLTPSDEELSDIYFCYLKLFKNFTPLEERK